MINLDSPPRTALASDKKLELHKQAESETIARYARWYIADMNEIKRGKFMGLTGPIAVVVALLCGAPNIAMAAGFLAFYYVISAFAVAAVHKRNRGKWWWLVIKARANKILSQRLAKADKEQADAESKDSG